MDEEAFDVDAFCETLFAYLPETSVISPIEITEWMFALAKEQRELKASEKRIQLDLKSVIEETTAKKPTASAVASNSKNRKTSEGSGVDDNQKKRVKGVSESSDQSDPDVRYSSTIGWICLEVISKHVFRARISSKWLTNFLRCSRCPALLRSATA